jgi:hypothetical protein
MRNTRTAASLLLEHLENGGAVFYTSFYDICSRARYRGPDDAWSRYAAILDEYGKDGLLRDPPNSRGARWVVGIVGEFPESGLPATVPLYAFLGAEAHLDHLELRPRLPCSLVSLQVRGISCQGVTLDATLGPRSLVLRVAAVRDGSRLRVRVVSLDGKTAERLLEEPGATVSVWNRFAAATR